ncbi:MAG: bifunctional pyr operon transcriptional regulator/uracil phosphoribosyltransferase PyrR [bacterium]
MTENVRAQIVNAEGLNRTITRLSHEIVERNRGVENLVVLGIRTRGAPIAERITEKIYEIEHKRPPLGILDVTMYRDDVFKKIKLPKVRTTEIKFNIDGKIVILIDDVLYTGRTVRAALDAIMDFGRPTKIELAVLVDRGHRELPIRADYVGKNVPTSLGQEVQVKVKEVDCEDGIFLVEV